MLGSWLKLFPLALVVLSACLVAIKGEVVAEELVQNLTLFNGYNSVAYHGMKDSHQFLEPNQWRYFYFTSALSTVHPGFFLYSPDGQGIIDVVDLNCYGDRFLMFNLVLRTNTSFWRTASVPTQHNCSYGTGDPDVALRKPGYSKISYPVPDAGAIGLTPVVLASPYGGGKGAIRFRR